jgi:hypothetical protein
MVFFFVWLLVYAKEKADRIEQKIRNYSETSGAPREEFAVNRTPIC